LALATDDTLLARAPMTIGMHRGDADVVERWRQANTGHARQLERLWHLTHVDSHRGLGHALEFEMLFAPVE
jgi:hypothetical protein